jgi:hypothetical protein
MFFSVLVVNRRSSPPMNAAKSTAIDLCSSGVTRPTHGAAHLPMSPSRQGRPVCFARA